jgi:HEAT repeat protein
LVKTLGDADVVVAESAQRAILAIGDAGIPESVQALQSSNAAVRARATWILGHFVRQHGDIVPDLLRALHDSNAAVRINAAIALGDSRSEVERVVTELCRSMSDPNHDVRWRAIEATGRLGPSARAATGALLACLDGPDPQLRPWAARALGKIHPPDDTVVAHLAKAVKATNDPPTRLAALQALGQIGPSSEEAIAAIVDILKTHRFPNKSIAENTRREAITALGNVRHNYPLVVQALIVVLGNEELSLPCRAAAANSLGALGPEASAAIPALLRATTDKYPLGRSATDAMKRIQSQARHDKVRR